MSSSPCSRASPNHVPSNRSIAQPVRLPLDCFATLPELVDLLGTFSVASSFTYASFTEVDARMVQAGYLVGDFCI